MPPYPPAATVAGMCEAMGARYLALIGLALAIGGLLWLAGPVTPCRRAPRRLGSRLPSKAAKSWETAGARKCQWHKHNLAVPA